jgi:hypothetical protein
MASSSDKWNEWSMRVLEELTTLNAQVESLDEKQELLRVGLEERFGHIEKKIEKANDLLSGNGTPEKGIIIRLDRLEQTEQRRTWLLRSTVVSCIGAIVSAVFQWMKN